MILNLLIDLVRKESEIISLYDFAFKKTNNPEITEKYLIFQQDHKRHLEILLDMINNVDIENPGKLGTINPNDQATFSEISGQNQVAEELLVKEKEINILYENSLELDVDSKAAEILDENLEDEQQHVRFFEIWLA
ncbi:MAG TPA: ferritin-like domain-containing protein [Chitinispirillaceae bacterium]|nr:ferritin-like domain-containing protein [Chitinispirillaceae bacterium]